MRAKHFLLVDDDECTNFIMDRILKNIKGLESYKIESDSYEAFKYLEKCEQQGKFPDIIFVDLKMPGITGMEFIKEYEKKFVEKFPESRIIVLSSSARERDRKESLNHISVRDFINKPLTREKIGSLVAG